MTAMTESKGLVGNPSETLEEFAIATTVLIVDDYMIDRRIAGSIVEKFAGLTPTYASDGHEALESIALEEPAVVLTDLQMPGMGGLALVQNIREKFPRLPVILMTAHGSEDIAIQALRAGATNYVTKKTLGRDLAETLPPCPEYLRGESTAIAGGSSARSTAGNPHSRWRTTPN